MIPDNAVYNRTPNGSFLILISMFACMHAKLLQLCLTVCDPMDYSLPGSSVHGILQARILDWVAMPCSRESSRPRDRTHISYVSCIGRRILCHYGRLESPVQSAQLCPTQSCLTLGDPIDCSMPGFPVFPPTPRVDSNSCPLNQ